MRFGCAAVALDAVLFVARGAAAPAEAPEPMARRAWAKVSAGVFCVTFLTPLITTWTMFVLPLAVAITLSSLTPAWSLPVGLYHGQPVTRRAVVGAALATGGVALLARAVT